MDYIREELLRQRAVLARLLLGRTEEKPEEEQGGAAWEDAETEDAFSLTDSAALFYASRQMAEGERRFAARDGGRTEGNESWDVYGGFYEALQEPVVHRMSKEEAPQRRHMRSHETERMTAVSKLQTNSSPNGRKNTVGGTAALLPEERMVTETVWASEGRETDARELSRIFQRDARRYDGGFTLY